MKTILGKILKGPQDFYSVIEHDLQKLELKVLRPWEILGHSESSSFRVNRGIESPSYISTLEISVDDDLTDTQLRVEDIGNVFQKLYESLMIYNELDILKKYDGYCWVFDKKSIYLQSNTNNDKKSILEPFKYWLECNDYRILYNNPKDSILREFVYGKDIWLINTNLDNYAYPVFRTGWYDTLIYTEYVILQLKALNLIYSLFYRHTDENITILQTPIKRNASDIAIDSIVDKLNNRLLSATNLSDLYDILNNYDNKKLAYCYISVIKELSFISETVIDWGRFQKVYKKHLDIYTLAILMYMRWNFIRTRVEIPRDFYVPLDINTPIGTLTVKGGEPVWKISTQ